jgi:hypothetical protein
LADLQVGGTSVFKVGATGSATIVGNSSSTAAAKLTLAGGAYNGANTGAGAIWLLGYNNVANIQQWFGDAAYVGNSSATFVRFLTNTGITAADCISGTNTTQSPFTINYSGLGFLGGIVDTILTRRAAANLNLGAADAAAPVAQTLSVQSVVAGTSNTAGTNFTIAGSQGTGTGVGGDIIFQVAPAGTTGTAQNALATAMRVYNNKTVFVGAGFTVAGLPAAGTAGRRAYVTDLNTATPTFLATLTGGGSNVCPVFDNGTAWVAG